MIPIDYRTAGFLLGPTSRLLKTFFFSSPFKGNRVGENAWGISYFIITGTGAVEYGKLPVPLCSTGYLGGLVGWWV